MEFVPFVFLQANISNFDLVMESDLGTFAPVGLQFTGSEGATAIMTQIMKLLAPINITSLEKHAEGTDINMWMQAGVPGQYRCPVCAGLSVIMRTRGCVRVQTSLWNRSVVLSVLCSLS